MAGQNGQEVKYSLSSGSLALLRCLTDPSLDQITWAKPAAKILTRMQQIYDIYNMVDNLPGRALLFGDKLKELDRYMYIDLEKQIATFNFHIPYYLSRIGNIIDRAANEILVSAKSATRGVLTFERSKVTHELFDVLWAELEAAFIEFGFCTKLQLLDDVDEVNNKLETLNRMADILFTYMTSQDRGKTMKDLQTLVAEKSGVEQSLSDHIRGVTMNRMTSLSNKISRLEERVVVGLGETAINLKTYLTIQLNLNLPVVSAIPFDDFTNVINSHNMHPHTRNWVFDRIDKFLQHRSRRILFLTAREGFEIPTRTQTNHLTGLVQSFANGLARTVPEYVKYLEDNYGQTSTFDFAKEPWHIQYDHLLRKPLNKLYLKVRPTSGRALVPAPQKQSRLFVIDGIGRCFEQDFVRTFLVDFIKDFPDWMRLVVTVNSSHLYNVAMPDLDDYVETLKLDDRPWMGMHIRDIQTYIAMAISALLQEAAENMLFSNRARSDERTLQNVLEELTRYSCGRFDYTLELVNSFAEEMAKSGQFLGSVKKAQQVVSDQHGRVFDQQLGEFAPAFRSYRDREGREILVSPVSASHSIHLLSLMRIGKLKSRSQNGTTPRNSFA